MVIPVYGALPHVKECLRSVREHTPSDVRVLVIDDASPDKETPAFLAEQLRTWGGLELLKNPRNLGYTRTVNRGIRSCRGDVLLLNSDAVVTDGWVDKLWLAAYSRPNVATVTPVSNGAGAFNVPDQNTNASLPPGVSVKQMGHLVESMSDRRLPEAPTGNGFCMYITAHALERVGLMDEKAFPRGYGEENDFAMRARREGLIHLVDDSTFIFHARGSSFGEEKDRLMVDAREVLRGRYPEYSELVKNWLDKDCLSYLRPRLRLGLDHALTADRDAKGILYVLHDAGGGTSMTSVDLAARASKEYPTYLLRMGEQGWRFSRYFAGREIDLAAHSFARRWDATSGLGSERIDAMVAFLERYSVGVVHVRHLLGAGPELLMLVSGLGYRIVFSLHDFLTICPNIQLINNRNRYCGGRCNTDRGDCGAWKRFFPRLPLMKNAFVYHWRLRTNRALRACDVLITTSDSAKAIVMENLPASRDRPFHVIPHGRDFPRRRQPRPAANEFRLVTMGGINRAKGGGFLVKLMELARSEDVPIELHVFGPVESGVAVGLSRYAVLHGPYDRKHILDHIESVDPAAAILPSVWPETFCHTLTEAWAAGLPCFVSSLGALGDRVQEHGGGWTFDPVDPMGCLNLVRAKLADRSEMKRVRDDVREIRFRSTSEMYRAYDGVYKTLE